jgi:hypothetical protein
MLRVRGIIRSRVRVRLHNLWWLSRLVRVREMRVRTAIKLRGEVRVFLYSIYSLSHLSALVASSSLWSTVFKAIWRSSSAFLTCLTNLSLSLLSCFNTLTLASLSYVWYIRSMVRIRVEVQIRGGWGWITVTLTLILTVTLTFTLTLPHLPSLQRLQHHRQIEQSPSTFSS